MTPPAIHRGFTDLAVGQIHHASCGPRNAPAVLLQHQSPRSWLEYRALLPLLGQRYRAIAMDTIGFGDSAPPPWPPSIERWAEVAAQLPQARVVDIEGGMVPLPDQMPQAFAKVVLGFLAAQA